MKKTNSRIMAGPIATFPAEPAASLEDSVVKHSAPRTAGPPELARRKNNQVRDAKSNLGRGKPTSIVTD